MYITTDNRVQELWYHPYQEPSVVRVPLVPIMIMNRRRHGKRIDEKCPLEDNGFTFSHPRAWNLFAAPPDFGSVGRGWRGRWPREGKAVHGSKGSQVVREAGKPCHNSRVVAMFTKYLISTVLCFSRIFNHSLIVRHIPPFACSLATPSTAGHPRALVLRWSPSPMVSELNIPVNCRA